MNITPKIRKILIGCSVVISVSIPSAIADTKPRNFSPAGKAMIAKIFSGNSWRWSHGGAYHSPDGNMVGKWHAIGNNKGRLVNVIGYGKWNINQSGTLCHKAEWRWRRNGELKVRKVKDCWRHVIDEKGKLWQHDQRHGWYRFPKNQIRSGDRFSKQYKRISKAENLWNR